MSATTAPKQELDINKMNVKIQATPRKPARKPNQAAREAGKVETSRAVKLARPKMQRWKNKERKRPLKKLQTRKETSEFRLHKESLQ